MIHHLAGRIGPAAVIAAGLLLASGVARAQSTQAAKDGKKLVRAGDAAQQAVSELTVHVREVVDDYNAIVYGSTKKPESSYKRLSSHRAGVDRKIQAAMQSVEDMNARAAQYFTDWEAELERYTSASVRDKSAARLESTKQRYATIAESLAEAREAFVPLLGSLDDQLLFLGRDLSPGAVADLGDEALELNRRAEDVFVTVDDLMARVEGVEAPADVVSAD